MSKSGRRRCKCLLQCGAEGPQGGGGIGLTEIKEKAPGAANACRDIAGAGGGCHLLDTGVVFVEDRRCPLRERGPGARLNSPFDTLRSYRCQSASNREQGSPFTGVIGVFHSGVG